MLYTLEGLQKQQLIQIQDGAVVSWPAGASKPKTNQLSKAATTGAGALGGAFWGFLFGLLFFVPFFGLAVGAAVGALAGHFSHYGIDDDFINSVRSKITPGTSALFLLTSGAVLDKVAEAVKDIPYNKWREYDPEDTIRFYALRLHEVGMIKSTPQKIIAQGTDWRFLNELKKELKA